jgi:hypothetical protein
MSTFNNGQSKRKPGRRGYVWLFIVLIVLASIVYEYIASPLTTDWKPEVLHVPARDSLGIDYYHESMGYLKRTPAEIARNLAQIQQVTQNIKVYHNPFMPASLPLIKSIVQQAKVLHMRVVWTENDDTVTLTDTNWKTYADRVILDAAEAASVGVDEFLVGNEISIHNNGDPGFSDIQLPARVKQLAMDCRSNFSGPIGYEEGWYKSVSWQAATPGSLSHIYFTLYEPWYRFKVALDGIVNAFGKRAEIGELSTMSTRHLLNYNEEDWTRELLRRYDYAQQKGLITWLFTFADFATDGFGLFQPATGQPQAIWAYLRGLKTLFYHELPLSFPDISSIPGARIVNGNHVLVGEFTAPVLAHVPIANYVFRGTLSPLSASGREKWRATRLVFRYNDNENYYFLDIEPNGQKIQLFRRQEGTEVNLGSLVTTLQYMQKYSFELRVSGNGPTTRIQVFWDTVKIFDINDTKNTRLASGAVGMKNNGVNGEMEDLVLTDFEQDMMRE